MRWFFLFISIGIISILEIRTRTLQSHISELNNYEIRKGEMINISLSDLETRGYIDKQTVRDIQKLHIQAKDNPYSNKLRNLIFDYSLDYEVTYDNFLSNHAMLCELSWQIITLEIQTIAEEEIHLVIEDTSFISRDSILIEMYPIVSVEKSKDFSFYSEDEEITFDSFQNYEEVLENLKVKYVNSVTKESSTYIKRQEK